MYRLFAVVILCVLLAPLPASAVTIDTVLVGNPGNANDPESGELFGGVSYSFRMGKTEITVGQYVEFLNAVAKEDTYGLFNISMQTSYGPNVHNATGIARGGTSPNYFYGFLTSRDQPVMGVTWADAARFANWLHNGQPTGAQGLGTTENGSYFLNGATTAAALNAVVRTSNATWVVPSENEWYKAAYHQPQSQGGDLDDYWEYPMRSNDEPMSIKPFGSGSNAGNFLNDDFIANGFNDGYAVATIQNGFVVSNGMTDVGAYTNAKSFYGTFDQGGNLAEWTEGLTNGRGRYTRGGSWRSTPNFLDAFGLFGRIRLDPNTIDNTVGLRMAYVETVPEPSTLALAALGALGLLIAARRRR